MTPTPKSRKKGSGSSETDMSVYSAGNRLSSARIERGLTIDEAAHAVKMRPDKILALENDDYTRFGSPAYARGFLLIYSRYLGVDVSEQMREFEMADARVNVEEYQYLNHAPEPEKEERAPTYSIDRRRPPSVWPLVAFMIVSVVAGAGYWIKVQSRRLDDAGKPPVAATPTQTVAPAAPATPAPGTAPASAPGTAPVTTGAGSTAVAGAHPAAAATPAIRLEKTLPINELIVTPVKDAWVKIRRDSPDSPPVFEGELYAKAPPLKMKGLRFYVEVRDQSSVQIRNNGTPIAYQAPVTTIP
jgi:cytoskeletal protein RodZ